MQRDAKMRFRILGNILALGLIEIVGQNRCGQENTGHFS
jgi:hypothetical protein